jgi:hypothetical protein
MLNIDFEAFLMKSGSLFTILTAFLVKESAFMKLKSVQILLTIV